MYSRPPNEVYFFVESGKTAKVSFGKILRSKNFFFIQSLPLPFGILFGEHLPISREGPPLCSWGYALRLLRLWYGSSPRP